MVFKVKRGGARPGDVAARARPSRHGDSVRGAPTSTCRGGHTRNRVVDRHGTVAVVLAEVKGREFVLGVHAGGGDAIAEGVEAEVVVADELVVGLLGDGMRLGGCDLVALLVDDLHRPEGDEVPALEERHAVDVRRFLELVLAAAGLVEPRLPLGGGEVDQVDLLLAVVLLLQDVERVVAVGDHGRSSRVSMDSALSTRQIIPLSRENSRGRITIR